MTTIWIYSLISVFIVSAISLIGVFTIFFKRESVEKTLILLVGFSAGALLGDTFIHILPELIKENYFGLGMSLIILSGIFLFFILEKFIIWHHCHNLEEDEKCSPVGYMILFGDGIHNFIDGMIIAGAFLANVPLGIITALAVIFHEIPQEIGNFGILLHAGFSKGKALFFNFLSALSAVLGAVLVLAIGTAIESLSSYLLALTAGVFIYIACTDLIPELHKKDEEGKELKKSLWQSFSFLVGIGVMALLLLIG